MTTIVMPRDRNSAPIPVLSFVRGSGTHKISFNATSARNSTPFVSPVLSIYATEDCYIEVGGAGVTSSTSRHFIPKLVYLDIELGDASGMATHLAVVQATASGTLYISERI